MLARGLRRGPKRAFTRETRLPTTCCQSTPVTGTSALEYIRRFFSQLSATCARYSERVSRITWLSLLPGLVIVALVRDLSGSIGILFALSVVLAIVPTVLLYFVNSRLKAVSALPGQVEDLLDSVGSLRQNLSEMQRDEDMALSAAADAGGLRQRLRLLTRAAPSIWNMREQFTEAGRLDIILTAMSVANPGFALLLGVAYLLALIWCGAAVFLIAFWWLFS